MSRCGVDEHVQRVGHQVVGVVPAEFGAAHRRHRGDQRAKRDHVGALQRGPPTRQRSGLAPHHARQHPATLDELTGEGRQPGQVAERGAAADTARAAVRHRGQPGKCTGGIELDRRDPPRQQHRVGAGGARGDPNQLGGIQRRLGQRRQPQRRLARLAGTDIGEHIHRSGERVGTRRTQRLAATGDGALGVLRPHAETSLGRPETVQDKHARGLPSCVGPGGGGMAGHPNGGGRADGAAPLGDR